MCSGKVWGSVQLLGHVRFFATPWTAACQGSLSITNSWSLLKFMMPSNHLILVSSPSSPASVFPASESFPRSQFFTSSGQSIGVSALASVLPMSIQDSFLLGLIGLISLQYRGLSRVFSNTTVPKASILQRSALWSNSHIHT